MQAATAGLVCDGNDGVKTPVALRKNGGAFIQRKVDDLQNAIVSVANNTKAVKGGD